MKFINLIEDIPKITRVQNRSSDNQNVKPHIEYASTTILLSVFIDIDIKMTVYIAYVSSLQSRWPDI